MRRVAITPRPDWQSRVEEYGLHYHTAEDRPYWDESACYEFTAAEIDTLELATQTLHDLCMELVDEVVSKRMFALFVIPEAYWDYVARSWREREPSVYGRFDLAYDGSGPPKMMEYNADTPTGLVEAAVAQWFWLKDTDEHGDQFNSIHEKLIDAWKGVRTKDARPLHFAALTKDQESPEDFITAEYLRDTAIQAGFKTSFLDVTDIGWDSGKKRFVDLENVPIHQCFKLYPWEWMFRDEFGARVEEAPTRWVEPPWKAILSCKSILPLLYERHPDCPYLLPASFDPLPDGNYVRKPVHAREGANMQVVINGKLVKETDGAYGGPFVYQALAPMRPHDGRFPVLGTWIVNGVACGLGIREDDSLVTGTGSRFVPHRMVG